MSLNFIDTSNNNIGVPDATINADAVVMKATEGIGFIDGDCDPSYQEAKAAGKLLGVYDFARPDGNNAVDEANYFVDNVQGYIGETILILDWEHTPTDDVWWAKAWLDHVYERTGVRAWIYMNTSTANAFDWSPVWNDYALWVAQYRDMSPDYNWDMTWAGDPPVVNWPRGYVAWQWTSSGILDGYAGRLDCSVFYGDRDQWMAYANPRTVGAPTPPTDVPGVPAETPTLVDPIVVTPTVANEQQSETAPFAGTPANGPTPSDVVAPEPPLASTSIIVRLIRWILSKLGVKK